MSDARQKLGEKLSGIGALRDVWHGDEEREAWVNAPLSVVLDEVERWRANLPVTDAEVELCAQAAYDRAFLKYAPEDVDRWEFLVVDNDPAAESWREVARAVLEAARKARAE